MTTPEERSQAVPQAAAGSPVMVLAGGQRLDAVLELLRALPEDSGLAFVPVGVDDAAWRSGIERLADNSAMPALRATDGLALAANRLYFAAGEEALTIREGRFRLDGGPERSPDALLQALAASYEHRAAVIVLAGETARRGGGAPRRAADPHGRPLSGAAARAAGRDGPSGA